MVAGTDRVSVLERAESMAGRLPARARWACHLPLLLGLLAAAHGAALAISITTNEPVYELTLHALVTVGIAFSGVGILRRRSYSPIGSAIMATAFVAYAVRFNRGWLLTDLSYPTEVVGDEEMGLAALVAWFLVGFCFMQSQRENLVFVFVTGLAIFGLVATRNLNPEMLAVFLTFLLASVYCWGYDHFLRATAAHGQGINWWQWARAQLSGAALVFALASTGGALLGSALYHTTPRLYTGFGLQQRIWNWSGAHVSGYFLFRNEFELSGGPIRLSPDPVLKVKGHLSSLWHGRSYDTYSGHVWSRRIQDVRLLKRIGPRTFDTRETAARVPVEVIRGVSPQPHSPGAPVMGPGAHNPLPRPGPGLGPELTPRQQVPPALRGPRPENLMSGTRGGAPEARTSAPGTVQVEERIVRESAPPVRPGGAAEAQAPSEPGPPGSSAPRWRFEKLRGTEVRQDVEVLAHSTVALFAVPYPYRLQFGPPVGPVDVAHTSGVRTDSYGSLQASTTMVPGQTYTVWSRWPEFSPQELRAVPDGQYSRAFREQYIEQNSLEVVTELGPLVERLTRGLSSPYDRALAIQRYLEEHCLYTLNVPFVPRGHDPVVDFVLHSRRGACDLFASSMTLMCRLAGIPARIATGFSTGEYDPEQDVTILRGQDAHAWSELYFPGYGWIPFDLSPAHSLEDQSLTSLLRFGQWGLVLGRLGRKLLWTVLVVGTLFLLAGALVDPRALLRAAWRRWHGRRVPRELLAMECEALLRLLARKARLCYHPARTPQEVLRATVTRPPLVNAPELVCALEDLLTTFYQVRYGREVSARQVESVRRNLARMRGMVRGLPAGKRVAAPRFPIYRTGARDEGSAADQAGVAGP